MQAVKELEALGYQIALQNDNLKLTWIALDKPDPARVKPLLEELKSKKSEAAEYLRKREQRKVIDFDTEARKVHKALDKYGLVSIRSSTLDGEIIYFAKDRTAADKAPKGAIVYTMTELVTLTQHPPDRGELQEIHKAKKMFGGELIDLDRNKNAKLHRGKGPCNHTTPSI